MSGLEREGRRLPALPRGAGCGTRAARRGAAVALALLALCPALARADEVTGDVVVLSLAAAADHVSTRYALSRCLGCVEGNPVMREPAGALLLKTGGVAATSLLADRLRRRGHGRAAKVLRWTVTGAWVGMAIHNSRKAR